MAFGRKEWKEHLKADPGIAPHLPPQVYRTAHKLQETHILTLIPKQSMAKRSALTPLLLWRKRPV